jgi:L-alanine-DL-glutamate epimerase-like enolase superfamily enzyme
VPVVRVETFVREPVGIVRLTTADGTTGTGQLAPFHADVAALVVHRQLARHVLGAEVVDVAAIAALGEQCRQAERKFAGSHLSRAWAGIDTALWDLVGRCAGQPVCVLAGGRVRPIEVYASDTSRRRTGAEEARLLVEHRERFGYPACKVKVGAGEGPRGVDGDDWPGRTEEVVRAVGGALGPGVLMVDGNGSFTPARAVTIGRLLEDVGGVLFEEPCPHWDDAGNAEVAEALAVDVGLGEQEHDIVGFRRIVRAGAADVLQPDVGYAGGFTTALEVARLATASGLRSTPHSANRSLVALYALHLRAACGRDGPPVELAVEAAGWTVGLYRPAIEVVDGRVAMPDGPGWGVEVPPAWLAAAHRTVSEVDARPRARQVARRVAGRARATVRRVAGQLPWL